MSVANMMQKLSDSPLCPYSRKNDFITTVNVYTYHIF